MASKQSTGTGMDHAGLSAILPKWEWAGTPGVLLSPFRCELLSKSPLGKALQHTCYDLLLGHGKALLLASCQAGSWRALK